MAEISSTALTAGTAVASLGLSAFASFMPELREVMNDDHSPDMKNECRFGATSSAVATLSVGVVLAYLTKSLVPVFVALGISAILFAVYDFAYQKGIVRNG